jgi:hypothetical protein
MIIVFSQKPQYAISFVDKQQNAPFEINLFKKSRVVTLTNYLYLITIKYLRNRLKKEKKAFLDEGLNNIVYL